MVLSDVTRRTNDSLQLEFGIEVRIFLLRGVTRVRGFQQNGNLLAEWRVTGHALNRLFRTVLRRIDNLSPRAGSHGAAVETLLPIRVLLGVATAAGLGAERNLFFRKRCRSRSLQRNGFLPIALEKILDGLVYGRSEKGL